MPSLVHGPIKPPAKTTFKAGLAPKLKVAAQLGAVTVFENLTGMRFDPAPAYLFFVELEGIAVAFFTECSGIEVKRDVVEWIEGGNNNYVHKMPGRVSYPGNITLKRGLSVSQELWGWFHEGQYDFKVQRINFSIIQGAPGHNLLTAVGGAIATAAGADSGSGAFQFGFQALGQGFGKVKHWNVLNAFPVSWKGPELSASSKNVAIEQIEIAHEGIELSWEMGTPLSIGASVVGAAVNAISG